MSGDTAIEPLGPDGLDALLVELAGERWSGTVRFAGQSPASLFFEDGRLYFAVSDAQALTAKELAAAGIAHTLWQEAGGRPGAKGRFAEELMHLGCDRNAVERFVDARLAGCIAALRDGALDGYTRGNGRHGFGASVTFDVDRYLSERPPRFADDTLISLDRSMSSPVTIDATTWNALAGLVAPMRFAELSDVLGAAGAERAVSSLERLGLVSIVSSHTTGDAPSATTAEPPSPARSNETPEPTPAHPIPSGMFADDTDDDYEEYVPERVGRQTYAAIASMRANRAEPPPQEKAHALRRLIEAVRGL